MPKGNEILDAISLFSFSVNESNVGDIYIQALDLCNHLEDFEKHEGEMYLQQIRSFAIRAEVGWKLFAYPPIIDRTFSDDTYIQLLTIIATIHSLCYGFDRLDEVSSLTGMSSTPVRFYINSIYHHIAALFLLDKEKNKDPIGGMVYKTLKPIGLSYLLDEIKFVLDKPFEGSISFGETIHNIRNKFLVHGTFSPENISQIIEKTQLREFAQQKSLSNLLWELFNQSFILRLKLIAFLTESRINIDEIVQRYLSKNLKN